MVDLTGIMPALFTTYDDDGQVTTDGLEGYLRFCIDRGCSGFFVGGSTGEGLLQNTEERATFTEAVVNILDGEVPVVAHVGAPSTDEACQLARRAAEAGAPAVGSVLPIYYSVNLDATADYYRAIGDASDLPMLIYYFSGAASSTLNPEGFTEKLATIPNVVAMKYTSSDLEPFKQIINLSDHELTMIMGCDQLYLPALTLGADGCIGTTQNFMPELFASLQKSYKQGDIEEAENMMDRIFEIIHLLLRKYPVMAACRDILRMRGFDIGSPRRPLPPISDQQRDQLRKDLDDLDFFAPPLRQ